MSVDPRKEEAREKYGGSFGDVLPGFVWCKYGLIGVLGGFEVGSGD